MPPSPYILGPAGGLRAGGAGIRRWVWQVGGAGLQCAPIRCKRDQNYLVRATPARPDVRAAALLAIFRDEQREVGRRCVRLHAPAPAGVCPDRDDTGALLLGWFETPDNATHMQFAWSDRREAASLRELTLYAAAERDPKCHPVANVPRWAAYRPRLTVHQIVLPASLAALEPQFDGLPVVVSRAPRSRDALARLARGAAIVVDPAWVRELGLALADLERLALAGGIIIDLESYAGLLARCGVDVRLVTHASEFGLMSARVEYADVPTRGFALQDVLPFSGRNAAGAFTLRGIRANRAWKRYADESGAVTLLSSETPWADRHGDVLSAIHSTAAGDLIATDLPWLVGAPAAGLVAPRLALHLLRMHVGLPLADHLQYWNRWADETIVVRDIAELALRYPQLRPVRWAARHTDCAHLGLRLAPPAYERHLILRTGRIDSAAVHDGLPPEPMMILMKWLAREVRERTEFATRALARTAVTWQFDAAVGLKYATQFDAAEAAASAVADLPTTLRIGCPAGPGTSEGAVCLPADEGLYGDGSFDSQDRLQRHVRRLLAVGGR